MTQRDLAGDRYSVSYISAIERGKVQRPSQEVLHWCAARLGISVLELLGESVVMSSDGRWMQQQLSRFAYEQVRTQMLITSDIGGDVAEGLQRVRKMRRDGNAPVERALIWFSAYGSYLANELAEARQEAETYRQMVDEAHDARGIAAYYWLMGHIVLATGDIERAHLAFERALDAEPNAPGSPDAAQVLRRALAASLRALHDPARAHQVEAEALREYERFANPRENARWSRMRAEQAAEAGDYLSAYLFIRWAWNSQREAAAHRHAAATYLRHATYPADDVPTERRETELRRALELAGLTGDEETQVLAGAYLAQILAERGAVWAAKEALPLAAADASTESEALVASERDIALALARGWMALASGHEEAARPLAESVHVALEAPPGFARTDIAYADLLLWRLFERLGDEARAFVALRRAMARQR